MSFNYRPVISGQRKDPVAILMRGGLRVASWCYAVGSARKNRAYESGAADVHRSDAVVISVGNLTTGGTGKTPVVCYIAQWLRKRGKRVAIVSRGYGRGDADMNDEAMELHWRLPDVPHVQDPDRVEAARIAVDELEAEVVLMDDGFQHRRLHRDLDIVLIDATCPFGYGHQLPRGLLRESVDGLQRADVVLITRCGSGEVGTEQAKSNGQVYRPTALTKQLLKKVESLVRPGTPVCLTDHRPAKILEYPAATHDLGTVRGQRVAMVSGIGNPDALAESLQRCGMTVTARYDLPDHDSYSPETVKYLRSWVGEQKDVDMVVCTHKDLVKLQTDMMGGKPLRALLIELTVLTGGEELAESLSGQIADNKRRPQEFDAQ